MKRTKLVRAFLCLALLAGAGCGGTDEPGDLAAPVDAVDVTDPGHPGDPGLPGDPGGGDPSADPGPDAGVPAISVVPAILDFGVVAWNAQVQRLLTVRNDGQGDLRVTGVEIVQEAAAPGTFSIAGGTEAADALLAGQPVVVPGAQSLGLTVTLLCGGASGPVEGTLRVHADAAPSPVEVPLVARCSPPPRCAAVLVPKSLVTGVVPVGTAADRTVKVVSLGDGPCTFVKAEIVDCTAAGEGAYECPEPFAGGTSAAFSLGVLPATTPGGIPPGGVVDLGVRYAPLVEDPSARAVLRVLLHDPSWDEDVLLPAPPGVPNVLAATLPTGMSTVPGQVDFGQVTVGCWSRTQTTCVWNDSDMPFAVDAVALSGCGPGFHLKDVPSLPATVTNGAPVCFGTVYAPAEAGPDACAVDVTVAGQAYPIVLAGEGTPASEQTDVFHMPPAQQVDVLFVIDDSGSMCDEQARLIAAFASFLQQASSESFDYRVGVIGMNIQDPVIAGKLNRGNPLPAARWVDLATPDPAAVFGELADFGCDGQPPWTAGPPTDAQEAGLEAVRLALSEPQTTATGVACASDSDCRNNPTVCPGPATCPLACIEGYCGGWNSGFLRPDATLEIVVLSDEDDQSPSPVADYVAFVDGLKGEYGSELMTKIHALVGLGSDGGAGTCTSPDGGQAAAGTRYVQAATETGGSVQSICDADYAPLIGNFVETGFHVSLRFFLSRLAVPESVKVSVDGVACPDGWKYDAPSNSVIPDPEGPCPPKPGQTIQVRYDAVCFSE